MSKNRHIHPPRGHVPLPAAAIGSLAMLLAGGLAAFGQLQRVDAWLSLRFLPGNAANDLPAWLVWLGTAVVAYGLAVAMLGSPGTWRRLVLWISALVLILAWVPVLGLASYRPCITPWLVAGVWSGLCSLAYVRNHRMPCEDLTIAHGLPPVA